MVYRSWKITITNKILGTSLISISPNSTQILHTMTPFFSSIISTNTHPNTRSGLSAISFKSNTPFNRFNLFSLRPSLQPQREFKSYSRHCTLHHLTSCSNCTPTNSYHMCDKHTQNKHSQVHTVAKTMCTHSDPRSHMQYICSVDFFFKMHKQSHTNPYWNSDSTWARPSNICSLTYSADAKAITDNSRTNRNGNSSAIICNTKEWCNISHTSQQINTPI